jgi:hypothetical protein
MKDGPSLLPCSYQNDTKTDTIRAASGHRARMLLVVASLRSPLPRTLFKEMPVPHLVDDIEQLESILKDCSAKDTAWPPLAHLWDPGNPASMHCAMYALYANKHCGLPIEYVDAHYPDGTVVPHYRNTTVDLSKSQFPQGTTFHNSRAVTADDLLALHNCEAERFALFEQRVLAALHQVKEK